MGCHRRFLINAVSVSWPSSGPPRSMQQGLIQGPLVAAILFAMVGMDARQVTERQEPPKVGEILIVIGRPGS